MMNKNYSFTLISIFTLFGTITGQADDVLPPRFNFDRYSAMVNHSPFAIATAIALPSATPDFAKDLTWPMPRARRTATWLPLLPVRIRISKSMLVPRNRWMAIASPALNGQIVWVRRK